MSNQVSNRHAICQSLLKRAEYDAQIIVACSDSRGSGAMTEFAEQFPDQFVEVGIAEQNLVSICAGLASCGKKPFAISPAAFLSARSYEQAKVDVAYSNTNVKLIGISGGISYGALGLSHHSTHDIAAMCALPNMRVYLPSDRFVTEKLIDALACDELPAYVRVGRGAVEDVYDEALELSLDHAIVHGDPDSSPQVTIVSCGEMVMEALDAKTRLEKAGVGTVVLDAFSLKPFDKDTILRVAKDSELVVTVEEHGPYGGLHAQVCQILCANLPKTVLQISLPDEPVVSGKSKDVFCHYRMDGEGIAERILTAIYNG